MQTPGSGSREKNVSHHLAPFVDGRISFVARLCGPDVTGCVLKVTGATVTLPSTQRITFAHAAAWTGRDVAACSTMIT